MKSRFLDENEIKSLKNASTKEAFLPLLISLETGLRIGDVVALRVADVKPDGIHYKSKKTGKKGIAAISCATRKLLNKKGKWLFPSPYKVGQHLTRQAVWSRLKRLAKNVDIELEGVSPHSMRKVFAVELYRKKGFKAVQEALQHNYASTTEIYSFADWNTGDNANLPLKRRDLQLIVKMVLEALGQENR
ncbi:MAG: tyrosine-type recombinase/integrase [Clostridia bacterium]|nr:tyrosine-type recombinase/integrase [Clostridia bacterium]